MRRRTHRMYLEDILEAMEKIQEYVEGLDYEGFIGDDKTVDAVVRNLEVIGEASRNLPEEIKNPQPQVPWKNMIGLRNIAIHAYFGVDLKIIWEIIKKNIPETKPKIKAILNQEKEQA